MFIQWDIYSNKNEKKNTATQNVNKSYKYSVEQKKLDTKKIHRSWIHLYVLPKQATLRGLFVRDPIIK